jgi:hypothetical protein
MIKIKTIDKEEHGKNQYFIVYNLNKGIHTFGGTPEDIIEKLYEDMKERVSK